MFLLGAVVDPDVGARSGSHHHGPRFRPTPEAFWRPGSCTAVNFGALSPHCGAEYEADVGALPREKWQGWHIGIKFSRCGPALGRVLRFDLWFDATIVCRQ